jgi:ATP synthase protein I
MSQELINEDQGDDFRPLTPEQARQWRSQFPQESVWRHIGIQGLVGAAVVLAAYLFEIANSRAGLALSALYGVLVVIVPALVCARGLGSRFGGRSVGASVAKFFIWEFAKVALSVAMLISAPRCLADQLSWPALMLGLVFTFKGFWAYVVWRQCVKPKSSMM